jgi:hypothetical protein
MADLYCRGCGDELSVDEYGNDECDLCVASRPSQPEDFYCEEEEDE